VADRRGALVPAVPDRDETVLALANGYVDARGTLEESHPALAPGTFVNGFHETWPIASAGEAY
jgi:alpha,alpha-trehalose phosphorylase